MMKGVKDIVVGSDLQGGCRVPNKEKADKRRESRREESEPEIAYVEL